MDSSDDQANATGWRGSRDVWLDAAYALLIEGGIDAVKVQPLAKRLRIARTSFYWHFTDRENLLAALVQRWIDTTTSGMIDACRAFAETKAEAMLNLFSCFLDPARFDARLEFAVRSWALQDPAMTKVLHEQDGIRIGELIEVFRKWGHGPVDADTRARAVYLTQIGYISLQQQEDLTIRMARMPAYVEIFTGMAPEPRELARFHARHGYVPPDQTIQRA